MISFYSFTSKLSLISAWVWVAFDTVPQTTSEHLLWLDRCLRPNHFLYSHTVMIPSISPGFLPDHPWCPLPNLGHTLMKFHNFALKKKDKDLYLRLIEMYRWCKSHTPFVYVDYTDRCTRLSKIQLLCRVLLNSKSTNIFQALPSEFNVAQILFSLIKVSKITFVVFRFNFLNLFIGSCTQNFDNCTLIRPCSLQ